MKIFLVGMMGAGKSYWAQKLATKLNSQPYDLDNIVVEAEGMSISDIFTQKGEAYFREMEASLLRLFAENDNFILATGGGTPCFHENMEWMNANGNTIWVDEDLKIIAERIIPEMSHRPLLQGLTEIDVLDFLEKKYEERKQYYDLAQYHLGPFLEEKHFHFIID